MESIEALASTINSFQGGVVLVSHDARLIKDTVKELWVVENNTIDTKTYPVFEDYKDHIIDLLELEEERKELDRREKQREREEKQRRKEEAEAGRRAAGQKGKGRPAEESDDDDDDDDEESEDSSEESEEERKPAKKPPKPAPKPEPKPQAAAKKDKLNSFFAKKDAKPKAAPKKG
eukprot:TRINITY_DN10258_c1_g6_i1.p1 TRINITY_DN10258_c1_g6~~TRINITY_DN10258_c1_g6_i1.p1  ORF type:complete len:176 (-),score=82.18 TRINITY_DN10258_c1_g6_i1:149-676(-)